MPDAIVIGAGPNGLVAANMLADRGWSVTVFEAQPTPGGAVRSSSLIEPGFVNDWMSAFYPLAAISPVIGRMELDRFGLRWRHSPHVLAHPTADGSCPVLSTNVQETAASVDAFAPGDGEAWLRLFDQWQRLEAGLLGSLFDPFPPVRAGLKLVGSQRPSELLRLARFMTLSVRRLSEEQFNGAGAPLLLAGNALHADLFPESALSGFFGWLLCSLGNSVGFPAPEGGAGNLTAALVRRLEAMGGELHCSTRVQSVIVRGGRAVGVRLEDGTEVDAGRAVVADVVAPALYRDLVGEEHLPPAFLEDLKHFQLDTATVKVDWTLDGPIPWEAEAARGAGTVHVAEDLDALTLGAAQLSMGQIPGRPFLLVGQYSCFDPTRQPEGKETVWAYTHVPQRVKGDAGGDLTGRWDDGEADRFADRMEGEIERLAPGFRSLIRGRHIFTPKGLEAADENLVNGAINGGTSQIHQQLIFRPVPGLARPETPIKNLYLGSASAHPGGGVHGACGSNAARAALLHDRLRIPFRR